MLPANPLSALPAPFPAGRRGSQGLVPGPHGRSRPRAHPRLHLKCPWIIPTQRPGSLFRDGGMKDGSAGVEEGYTGGRNDPSGRGELGSRTGTVTGCHITLS